MGRSGYDDDYVDQWALIKWRGVVASAIRGKRGQTFLRELVEALDAMPRKMLVYEDLQNEDGVCALGAVMVKRGLPADKLDPENHQELGALLNIAYQLVQEIEWINDEAGSHKEPPCCRWARVRRWAIQNLYTNEKVKDNASDPSA